MKLRLQRIPQTEFTVKYNPTQDGLLLISHLFDLDSVDCKVPCLNLTSKEKIIKLKNQSLGNFTFSSFKVRLLLTQNTSYTNLSFLNGPSSEVM